MIDCLEYIHDAGYIYNDLKQDNIMITEQDDGKFLVTLVDFGLVSKYMKNGTHISEDERSKHFYGCLQFADMDKLNFYATTRKDDIQSLFHMLVCMLNDDQLYGDKAIVQEVLYAQNNPEMMIQKMRTYRQKYDIKNIIKKVLRNKMLSLYTVEVKGKLRPLPNVNMIAFKKGFTQLGCTIATMKYSEKPPYEKLKNSLNQM